MARIFRLTLIASAAALVLSACGEETLPEQVSGSAEVIDGRTLKLEGYAFRIEHLIVPEINQTCKWPNDKMVPCGKLSRAALMDLVTAQTVTCRPVTSAKPGDDPIVARCKTSDGYDLGWNMIHTGWAIPNKFAPKSYVDKAEDANAAGWGLHKGTFRVP